MADISIKKTHHFDLETARVQAQKWLTEAKSELGLDITYIKGDDQDTAHIKKAGVDAKAVLTDKEIAFEADLAFLAKPLKGVISSGIQEGLDKYFAT
ncbi:MAG: polyhydroxyalkanoic acid system family protein [Moraxella sp.]|nr:polyhydroxyalkanoic acid system family protein [Moraxella sp.]